MGFGRVRIKTIKSRIAEASLSEQTLQTIRNRIKEEVSLLIASALSKNQMMLTFDRIALFDPRNSAYVKEWIKANP